MHRQRDGHRLFGLTTMEIQKMSIEEYCAFGLGRFLESADLQLDDNCCLIDYSQLNIPNLRRIGRLFDTVMPDPDSPEFRQAYYTYSTDPSGMRMFDDDQPRKQREAPDSGP